jgi:hypothetical protein
MQFLAYSFIHKTSVLLERQLTHCHSKNMLVEWYQCFGATCCYLLCGGDGSALCPVLALPVSYLQGPENDHLFSQFQFHPVKVKVKLFP